MLKQIFHGIKTVFEDKNSIWISIVSALSFGYLFYWLFYKVTTLDTFFVNVQAGDFGKYSVLYAVIYWVTTVMTILLFGISTSVTYWLWKNSKLNKKISGANIVGVFTGAVGAACPVCGAFLLSALGIAGGLSIFPFQGLELKVLSLALIAFATIYGARKVYQLEDCKDCRDLSSGIVKQNIQRSSAAIDYASNKSYIIFPLERVVTTILITVFLINQFMISQAAATVGLPTGAVAQLFGIKTVAAKTIIAPKVNPDGRTTSLVEQPTITEVSANPNSGDALADAKVVMIATGKPFYAPDDISFDDPINAQKKWGAYDISVKLSPDLEARYQTLITKLMVCSYCCGSPTNVTLNVNCGCAHAKAVRGFYKYMLQTYAEQYTNDQLVGESHRWYAIWYPKGMLEDYLLASGKSEALPHQTHGGAGKDGRHGL